MAIVIDNYNDRGRCHCLPSDGASPAPHQWMCSWQIVALSCVPRTQTMHAKSQQLNFHYTKIVPIFKQ